MRVAITAGFDKAQNAIAIAELLRREGITISDVLVVNPYSFKRLNAYLKQRGVSFMFKAIKRLTGTSNPAHHDALKALFQKHKITTSSLKQWATEHKVAYHSVNSLNEANSINVLKKAQADWLVYAGGGILKRRFIEALQGRILNAHAGPLPEIRGMNACEWALLLGLEPHVTVHLINRGIDTGGIIKKYPIAVEAGDSIESLRSRATAVGIEALVATVLEPPEKLPEASQIVSRQCFILAPALKERLEQQLKNRS